LTSVLICVPQIKKALENLVWPIWSVLGQRGSTMYCRFELLLWKLIWYGAKFQETRIHRKVSLFATAVMLFNAWTHVPPQRIWHDGKIS
jgi:hypothetical protein